MSDYTDIVDATSFGVFLHLDEASGTPVNYGTDTGATIALTGAGVTYENPSILSTGSVGLTGNADKLSITGIADANFFDTYGTLHFWVYVTGYENATGGNHICSIEYASGSTSANLIYLWADASTDTLQLCIGSTCTSGIPFSRNTWHQVSINRSSTSLQPGLWIDGDFKGYAADTIVGNYRNITIGDNWIVPSTFHGYINHVHGTGATYAGQLFVDQANRKLWAYGDHTLNGYEKSLVNTDPRLLFPFNETSGTTVDSLLEAGNAWPLNGTPTFGEAGYFSGDGSIRFDSDGDNAYSFLEATYTSVSAWVKFNAHGAGDAVVLSRGADTGNGLRLVYSASPDRLRLQGSSGYSTTTFAITLGQWYHLVMTTNGGNEQLYVDGTLVIDQVLANSTSGYYVGWGDFPSTGNWCDANYSYATAWFDAVSSSEIATMYAAGAAMLGTSLSVPIEWTIPQSSVFVPIEWTGSLTSTISVPVEWTLPTAQLSVPIKWLAPEAGGVISVPIEWKAPDVSAYPAVAETWALGIELDGVDISTRQIGGMTIEFERNSSALAEFSISPASGPLNIYDYLGAHLVITRISGGIAVKRYTGNVSGAEYNVEENILSLSATTDIQGYTNNQERTAIDGVVGGYYSEHIFDAEADGWNYLQDRLSTQYAFIHQTADGFLRLASYDASGAAAYTFIDGEIYDGSITYTRVSRREVINSITVNLAYRFTKLRQRHVRLAVEPVDQSGTIINFCEYARAPFEPLQRGQVESAVSSSGWNFIGSPYYVPFPNPGFLSCSGTIVNWIAEQDWVDSVALGARMTIGKRFAQTITENYTVEVEAPNSIATLGQLHKDYSFAVENPCDPATWENGDDYSSVPAGFTLEASGDYVADQDTIRAEFNTAQVAAYHKAKNDIKKSHFNTVTFSAPFHPYITLGTVMEINHSAINMKGVVIKLVDHYDRDTGEESIEVTIAAPSHGGSLTVTDTPIAALAAPSSEVTTTYDSNMAIKYLMGGDSYSGTEDDSALGFSTNRYNPAANYPEYDNHVQFSTPAIDSIYRDEKVVEQAGTFDVDIPENPLTITV